MHHVRHGVAVLVGVALLLTACGDDTFVSEGGEEPVIAVTTNILGDVVENIVGDQAEVVTIMPVGSSPHDFQPSAQQVNRMREADVLIVNGAGFEEGLVDVIERVGADGVPTHEAISAVEGIESGDSGVDPHFFTDPARMAVAVEAIAGFLAANVAALDNEEFSARQARYASDLRALDAELEAMLSRVPEENRVLVTNHEVFGHFADRYGFEVVGTVIPAGSTNEVASGGDLHALARIIRDGGVPAIFADTSSPDRLASTLADEVGDVAVVELFSESLGEDGSDGETYLEMMRTNARRIVDALT